MPSLSRASMICPVFGAYKIDGRASYSPSLFSASASFAAAASSLAFFLFFLRDLGAAEASSF